MYKLIILLVLEILNSEAKVFNPGVQEIRLKFGQNIHAFTVLKDEPLKIIFENAYARFIWCTDFQTKNGVATPFTGFLVFNNDIYNIIQITNVTAAMNTKWSCTILRNYQGGKNYTYLGRNYTAFTMKFDMHVKGAKSVNITANGIHLTHELTSSSIAYDGDATYLYENGEIVDLSCGKLNDDLDGTLQLEYYSAEGFRLFRTDIGKETFYFRIHLKSSNDQHYIDCINIPEDRHQKHRYRTFFSLKNTDTVNFERLVTLSINGVQLVPIASSDPNTNYVDYHYKYVDGDVLDIACSKATLIVKGSLTFYFNSSYIKANRDESMGTIKISIDTSLHNVHKNTLICGINNTNIQKLYARVLLWSDVPEIGLRLAGLPVQNIEYQYTNASNEWVIAYQYGVNDSLDLTCVAKGTIMENKREFKWIFNNKTESSSTYLSNPTMIQKSNLKFNEILNENHNQSKIQCTTTDTRFNLKIKVVVILHFKPKIDFDTYKETEKVPVRVLMISVGVPIVVITLVCLISWCKKTKNRRLIQNPYEHFSNDSPIPAIPSQWENNYDDSHYTRIDYAVVRDNKFYAIPNIRQSTVPSENFYTEIDDNYKIESYKATANCNTASHKINYKEIDKGYDTLRRSHLDVDSKQSELYGRVSREPSKRKAVTFGETSSTRNLNANLRAVDNLNARISKEKGVEHICNVKELGKTNYENHNPMNNESRMSLEYATPYAESEVNCVNEFYG